MPSALRLTLLAIALTTPPVVTSFCSRFPAVPREGVLGTGGARNLRPRTRSASASNDDTELKTAETDFSALSDVKDRRGFLTRSAATVATAAASSFTSINGVLLPSPAFASDEEVPAAAPADIPPPIAAPLKISKNGAVELPPIGLGAWSWGDTLFWGYDAKLDNELREVFDYALSQKLAFFDTAELYGLGRSETLLATFRDESKVENAADQVSIATKFAALPWRTKASDVVQACQGSVKRLNGRPIDLYQIHFPNAWSNAEYWDGLADAYHQGLVRSVGVSNYGVNALRACHAALADRGVKLATNQIQLSLLYRWPLENGLLETCKELDIKVLSYSPLALGLLTGKYTKDKLPKGPRKKLAEKLFNDEGGGYAELLETIAQIGKNHQQDSGDEVPLSQVAVNWARAKGTTPIPGARNLRQVKENLGSLRWDLSEKEVRLLDDAAAKVPALLSPDDAPFVKKDVNTGLVLFDS